MKEPRNQVIVGNVSTRTLSISQLNCTAANQMSIVATQRCHMKRMNNSRQRRIATSAKYRMRLADCVGSRLSSIDGRCFGNQDARSGQDPRDVGRYGASGLALTQLSQIGRVFGAYPERKQSINGRVTNPRHRSMQGE